MALNEGLDAGLTINEIKEILVQMYAYAGFPRSLNGINTFMGVLGERKQQGIKDELGREASPLPTNINKDKYGEEVRSRSVGNAGSTGQAGTGFRPCRYRVLKKEHLFADIFGRDNLDIRSREIATISRPWQSMEGVNPMLQGFSILTPDACAAARPKLAAQDSDIRHRIAGSAGRKKPDNANEVLSKVLKQQRRLRLSPGLPLAGATDLQSDIG